MEDKESFKKVHPLFTRWLKVGKALFYFILFYFFSFIVTINCIDFSNDSINDEIGRRIDRYKIGNEKLRIWNVSLSNSFLFLKILILVFFSYI